MAGSAVQVWLPLIEILPLGHVLQLIWSQPSWYLPAPQVLQLVQKLLVLEQRLYLPGRHFEVE